MFQYAAGRCLSLKHKVPLLLDPASYEPRQAAMYALDGLKISAQIAEDRVWKAFQPSLPAKILNRLLPARWRRIYKEPFFHFAPDFFRVSPPVYLKGYWQSWRYFEPVKDIIREDFRFHVEFPEAVLEKAAALAEHNSVAMHFRRGDYTSSDAVQYHGICEPAYYQQAAQYMLERLPDARFYIFTNDPEWVRNNLPPGIPCEILSGALSHTQYEDLFLMSRCRHQVIANSSFSWWAAWLNTFENKHVVAPQRWFATSEVEAKDLVPGDWHRI